MKYSENTSYVTPDELIAKINNAGAPKFAEKLVINVVSYEPKRFHEIFQMDLLMQ